MTKPPSISGKELQGAMLRRGLSVRDVAITFQMSESTIRNWLQEGVPPGHASGMREILGGAERRLYADIIRTLS